MNILGQIGEGILIAVVAVIGFVWELLCLLCVSFKEDVIAPAKEDWCKTFKT